MKDKFSEYIKGMPILLNELKGKPLLNRNELKDIPKSGIYVFYENEKPFYVGRSNRMKERILEHGRQSSDRYSATLAFRMAIKSMKMEIEDLKQYKRSELEKMPKFKKIYSSEKSKVSKMKVRVIEIKDQVEQTLFEVYVALKQKTLEYNDFGTH